MTTLDVAAGDAVLRVVPRPSSAVGVGGASVVVRNTATVVRLTVAERVVRLAAAGPAGPPGPAGEQPIHVGPTPPPDPTVNDLWVDTS